MMLVCGPIRFSRRDHNTGFSTGLEAFCQRVANTPVIGENQPATWPVRMYICLSGNRFFAALRMTQALAVRLSIYLSGNRFFAALRMTHPLAVRMYICLSGNRFFAALSMT